MSSVSWLHLRQFLLFLFLQNPFFHTSLLCHVMRPYTIPDRVSLINMTATVFYIIILPAKSDSRLLRKFQMGAGTGRQWVVYLEEWDISVLLFHSAFIAVVLESILLCYFDMDSMVCSLLSQDAWTPWFPVSQRNYQHKMTMIRPIH